MANEIPAARGAPRAPRARLSLSDARVRAVVYQALLAAAVGLLAWYLIANTAQNLQERKIASGFGFLSREAGFEISEKTLLSYSAADTYLRAIGVGLLNTLRVAAIGVILATALGTLIGLSRLSRNWLLARLAAGYVEVIRNVPLLVQLFFWYALISEHLPGPRAALRPLGDLYLSNRGIAFPILRPHPVHPWLGVALLAGAALAWAVARRARRRQARLPGRLPVPARQTGGQASPGRRFLALGAGAALAFGPPLGLYLAAGAPLELERPALSGFNFSGGGVISPEFAALLLGLATYTAAFIAEIVRAGVLAVDRGQVEAAHSLGLSRRQAMRLVVVPQALRVIVPPLTSQYLNLTKNSSLAVAIGYPDLVSIANTAMNQTGQAVEGIAIIMLAYLSISLAISAFMNFYNRRIALKGTRP